MKGVAILKDDEDHYVLKKELVIHTNFQDMETHMEGELSRMQKG